MGNLLAVRRNAVLESLRYRRLRGYDGFVLALAPGSCGHCTFLSPFAVKTAECREKFHRSAAPRPEEPIADRDVDAFRCRRRRKTVE
jgi:hypothetical protein